MSEEKKEEQDVISKEDHEKALGEAKDTYTSEKESLEAKITEKDQEIEKLAKKGESVENLRKIKESLETDKADLLEQHKKDLEEITNKFVGNRKDELIGKIAGEDDDLKKRMEAEYEKFKGDPQTPEEIEQRVKDAYAMATADDRVDQLGRVISSAGGESTDAAAEVPDDLKEIGKRFGLSDEDFKSAKEKGAI